MNHDEALQHAILTVTRYEAGLDLIEGHTYSYTEIAKMMNRLMKNGLITDLKGDLKITNIGLNYLVELNKLNDLGNITNIILPQYRYFIEKVDINKVYLSRSSTCQPDDI